MKIIDLLNDIENDEIEDGTIFEVIGDFFYKLIIIDKNLYCINEMTKKLEILDSKYIGRFDNRQYEIIKLSNKIEEKKIPEKLDLYDEGINILKQNEYVNARNSIHKSIISLECKYNQLIDYFKSKGE